MTTLAPAQLNVVAPLFDLPSSAGPVSLSAYRGRPVVVFFMREFSCPMCQGHVRTMRHLADQYSSVQFLVVGGGKIEEARRLASRFKLPFPVVADAQREAYAAYDLGKALGIMQRSGTAIIDGAGVLREFIGSYMPMSSLSEREIKRVLDSLK